VGWVSVRVRVGVAAGEAPAVQASVEYLGVHTRPAADVVRLARTAGPAFDELVAADADVYVLLEPGVLVAPRWLELILAAMERSGAGLAGPSTNRAWNEQASVRASGADLRAIRRDAAVLLRRYGRAARTLGPLYSLGDFCYAVRREVIAAIGTADPAYGDGPCWEMDYNLRAARAGFAGIWVGSAYAWRLPVAVESPLLEVNRRVYQDRYCGLRRLDPARPYETHCRGDDCPHFLRSDPVTTLPHQVSITITPRQPMISCIMPTRGRLEFALQATRYFLAQDHANAELIIVEDGDSGLADRLPSDPRIRHLGSSPSLPSRNSIGALRNLGCAAARGEIIVLWDDDDWHGPGRISHQVAALLAGTADITGLADIDWFDPAGWQAWRLTPELHARMLRHDVYGGTLAFRRSLWRRQPFPNRSLAEDADFLDRAVRGGARLQRLAGQGHYVYVRHATNSWAVLAGRTIDTAGWLRVPIPELPAADIAFYETLGRRGPATTAQPLVSCIMPTRDRRPYVAQAIEYFLRQDHPVKELIILDDGDDPVADLVPAVARIRYERLDRRMVLGAKRNLACELAAGPLIAHWDDDDWQAAHRLSTQVARLAAAGAEICGASSLLFWEPRGNRAWRYTWPDGRRTWAAGTSLCYPRTLWQRSPFAEVGVGEDTRFVWQAAVRRVADVRADNCVVGLIHPHNTVAKTGRGAYWAPAGINEVASCLGTDMRFYQDLRRESPVAAAAPG
jgi:glycosyltransferase involved in cell wall biosynthesis